MKLNIAIVAILAFGPGLAWGQGTFENLDFESAGLDKPLPTFGTAPIAEALPDWSASMNGVNVAEILLNTYSLNSSSIAVFGPNQYYLNPGVIDGDYTVCLEAQQGSDSIWQTGTVPANAGTLEFKAWSNPSANDGFSIAFANNNLSPTVIGSGETSAGQDYTVYSVDIQPYDGETGALDFTLNGGSSPAFLELDDLSFTATSTPEPSTFLLTGLGGAAVWLFRRWRRS